MELLIWIIILFIFYTYLGYPIFIYLLSIIVPRESEKKYSDKLPNVSIVIAARDEETTIGNRINNILEQDYPNEKLELIIVSDGSVDNTDDVVNMIKNNDRIPLKLISHYPSKGKPYSVNVGVKAAKGDIVVFADCRQRFATDAIKQLVSDFNDETIGCVSGELIFEKTPDSSMALEMGAYWNFEKLVRKLESKSGSVVGATGAIYAIRRKLYIELPIEALLDDVLTPLNISMQGYSIIFNSSAVAFDSVSENITQEKKRKIRTLAGNWQLLFLCPALLNPFKNPLFFRFISHKIFRLLIPFFLIALFVTCLIIESTLSIPIITGFFIFLIFSSIPKKILKIKLLLRISGICRAFLMLNYFAFLAPFHLLQSSNKLW